MSLLCSMCSRGVLRRGSGANAVYSLALITSLERFLAQFGMPTSPGGCPWDGVTRDADFDVNGVIGSTDYNFLTAGLLSTSACACTIPLTAPDLSVPITKVPQQWRSKVDLDRDGVVNHRDVRLFEQANGLPHTLSSKMRQSVVMSRRR